MTTEASENLEVGKEVLAGGIWTNYHDMGRGSPVVLLHGSGPGVSAWANWRLTMPHLSQSLRVLAPDIMGFGYTERAARTRYSLDTWTAHILEFLNALELDRVSLVGNSFGGALALALASRHPDRIDRLVLMGSAGLSFPITAGLDEVWGYEPSVERMRQMLDIFAFDRSLVSDELAELRHTASTQPGVQEAYASMFPAPRQRWVDALATEESRLSTLPQPTLIVHGRDDRIVPLESSLRLLQLIPKARLHVFGQCGHWTQIEHAAEFNRLIADFLTQGVPPAR
jgi:pimeloyl-ACP methyl ester carboxylesterase